MEPRFNEVSGDRPNLFVKWRVRYIEVLFHTFYCNFCRDIEIISFVISRTSLNRGSLNRGSTVLRYISDGDVRSIFLGLKFAIWGLFLGLKFCSDFFWVRDFGKDFFWG